MKSITDENGFLQTTILPGAYEIENLNNEIKKNIIDEGHYSENEYPFTIKANFSTLCSIIGNSPQGPIIIFMFDDNITDLLGFNARTIYEEYTLSSNPVNILSFYNNFLETDIAQGMISKGKRSGILHNFTMDVDPGSKYIENLRGGVQWYMMESKDVISSIKFKLKNENNELVTFNGQSISFHLSIKEI